MACFRFSAKFLVSYQSTSPRWSHLGGLEGQALLDVDGGLGDGVGIPFGHLLDVDSAL